MVVDLLKRLDSGMVSDEELRRLIRFELERRLKWGYKPTHQQQLAQILNLAHSVKQMKIATEMDALNSTMYEMPIPFLQILFGSNAKESCLYFKDGSTTVDEAEIAMMDLYLERAQIKDGQIILDLGCGLGPLAFHIAQKYTNCNVTSITNSDRQKEFIEEKCKFLDVSNVKVILADICTLEMEVTFDRIFAIGLIEDDVSVVDHWTLSGKHYSRTCEEWLKRMDNKIDEVKEIFEAESQTKDDDDIMKLINHWRFLCISFAEMFGYNNGEEWMFSHVLFKKKKQI